MDVVTCLSGRRQIRSLLEHDAPTGRTKNDRIVEEAWRRNPGDPNISDWMFGVGDIDFVLARNGSTNTRADHSAAAVGTVTVLEPGEDKAWRPSHRCAYDRRQHRASR
jgi:hypothetical protein